jgi:uncharacterized membrane protein (UPF0127 family)
VDTSGPAPGVVITGPDGRVIADRVRWARTRRERIRGLIGSRPLEPAEALIIERARQVHTFNMTYAIDVVICDASWVVRHVVCGMQPGRITRPVLRARYVLEFPEGSATELEVGDRLRVGAS